MINRSELNNRCKQCGKDLSDGFFCSKECRLLFLELTPYNARYLRHASRIEEQEYLERKKKVDNFYANIKKEKKD